MLGCLALFGRGKEGCGVESAVEEWGCGVSVRDGSDDDASGLGSRTQPGYETWSRLLFSIIWSPRGDICSRAVHCRSVVGCRSFTAIVHEQASEATRRAITIENIT